MDDSDKRASQLRHKTALLLFSRQQGSTRGLNIGRTCYVPDSIAVPVHPSLARANVTLPA